MKFTPVDTGLPQRLSFKNWDTEIQGAGSVSRAQIHTVATPEAGLVSAIDPSQLLPWRHLHMEVP